MREADAPSTAEVTMLSRVCPPHRGKSWSHHSSPRATQRGRKAKAAPGTMGRASAAGEEGADTKERRIRPTSTLLYLAPKAGTSAERHILHTLVSGTFLSLPAC
jgi:hypothetical protein